jgi:TPP-dependent 2-oxoacid decarboxylase
MNVADYLITRLKQIGLEHIFAVPGDYAVPFLVALGRTKGIERVANVSELGCGYAADGYARCWHGFGLTIAGHASIPCRRCNRKRAWPQNPTIA